MSPPEALQILESAVLALCSDGSLVSRLAAAHGRLSHIEPQRDLPAELRFRHEELMADFSYGADTLEGALGRMSRPDQERLVQRVVGLFGEVARHMPADL